MQSKTDRFSRLTDALGTLLRIEAVAATRDVIVEAGRRCEDIEQIHGLRRQLSAFGAAQRARIWVSVMLAETDAGWRAVHGWGE